MAKQIKLKVGYVGSPMTNYISIKDHNKLMNAQSQLWNQMYTHMKKECDIFRKKCIKLERRLK